MDQRKTFWNWGNVLILVFIIFAGGMTTLGYKSCNTPPQLTSSDYYKKELDFQDSVYNPENNAAKLSPLTIIQDAENITVTFPKELDGKKITGDVYFYCPSRESSDKHINVALDSVGKQTISKTQLTKNIPFKVRVMYKADTTSYFTEKDFTVK